MTTAPTSTLVLAAPPGGWGSALADSLGIALWRIPVVIASAIGVYLAFLVLVRIFGARALTAWSTFDAVVIIMFGAVAGRAVLGHPPTLAAGLIGLVTLMVMEAVFGQARNLRQLRGAVASAPEVVMAHGEVVERALRRQHVTEFDLTSALRRAGVSDPSQVQCVIAEPTGALSVLRVGEDINPWLLRGVVGAHLVTRQDGDGGSGESGTSD
ncbi:MAG TPA: DUF421 domain-containing protein [Candidatus Corynebacterium avicola]|uniref:DUF421 domain-containing protein n=1 Tax=Candidatus Corynebacterium avicola TaxID=2838527 RepID=A0A9D1UN01_9CORY|nr:DUF421 domain-containing protein [Candidatus Corynebacterium avicola]